MKDERPIWPLYRPEGRDGFKPGRSYVWLRYLTQSVAFFAIIVAPFLGGWQRLERSLMSAWDMRGWDLPGFFLDVLPRGEAAKKAYEYNDLLGGGTSIEFFGIPVADPLAGAVALFSGEFAWHVLIAWTIPVVLALVFGRIFCGWFCPFGVLARITDRIRGFVPTKFRGFDLPDRRPLRWVVLGLFVLGGIFGAHGSLYLLLPHAMVQQAGYSMWLLGGGGAVLGALLGLIAAGVVVGPTIYCAAICPTGAALSFLSRFRRVHVDIEDPDACGKCTLCTRTCWLGLDPAQGDPGPDCDLCTRCFSGCPRENMGIHVKGLGETPKRASKTAVILLVVAASMLAAPSEAPAQNREQVTRRARLLLNGKHQVGDMTLMVSVIDANGVRLSLDQAATNGTVISGFLGRGERGEADERGQLPSRDVYRGPLTIRLKNEKASRELAWRQPTSPISTPRRSIYREEVDFDAKPGTVVTVEPVEGWFSEPVSWEIRDHHVGDGVWRILGFFVAGGLIFFGLIAIALGLGAGSGPDGPESAKPAE